MRKQTFLALLLTFGLTAGGCAWFGGDSSSTEAAVTPAQPAETAEPAPAPEAPAPGKAGKKVDKKAAASAEKKQPVVKGAKTEAQIAAELDSVGRKLVAQAGRTVVPSKSKKDVQQVGKDFVASYVEVDESSISTELRPGASGPVSYTHLDVYKRQVRLDPQQGQSGGPHGFFAYKPPVHGKFVRLEPQPCAARRVGGHKNKRAGRAKCGAGGLRHVQVVADFIRCAHAFKNVGAEPVDATVQKVAREKVRSHARVCEPVSYTHPKRRF